MTISALSPTLPSPPFASLYLSDFSKFPRANFIFKIRKKKKATIKNRCLKTWGCTEAGLGQITNRHQSLFPPPPNDLLISKTFQWPTSSLVQSLIIPVGYSEGHSQVLNTQEAASTLVPVQVPWEKPISWTFLREFIASIFESSEFLCSCISCHCRCIWLSGHSFWVLPSGQQEQQFGQLQPMKCHQ